MEPPIAPASANAGACSALGTAPSGSRFPLVAILGSRFSAPVCDQLIDETATRRHSRKQRAHALGRCAASLRLGLGDLGDLALGSEREAAWIRLHWSLVGPLRGALRTEPNAELAVLFGSAARGDDIAGSSDVDLLVQLRRSYPGALEAMRGRLNEHGRPEVQLVPLQAALRNPLLMAEVLRDGRPLVDRSGRWPELKARAEQTDMQAARVGRELRTDPQAAIGYFQRLADARARSPVGTGR